MGADGGADGDCGLDEGGDGADDPDGCDAVDAGGGAGADAALCGLISASILSKAARASFTVASGPSNRMKRSLDGPSTMAPSCVVPGRGAAAPMPM